MRQFVKAILFDLGGVVIEYNDPSKYMELIKLINGNPALKQRFLDFEQGRIGLIDVEEEFLQLFGVSRKDDLEKSALKQNMSSVNPFVAKAIKALRASAENYTLAILTNNGFWDKQRGKTTFVQPESLHFDFVIESCKIGHRKPDAAFYKSALDKMGLKADECVFIDDLEVNCKGAEAVGIKSIWLKNGDGKTAMEELERILGVGLL